MTAITKGARVVLTAKARDDTNVWRYGDIGTRTGTVLRVDGWPVVQWAGMDAESWVPKEDLEIVP